MEVAFLQCLLHLRHYSLLTCGLGKIVRTRTCLLGRGTEVYGRGVRTYACSDARLFLGAVSVVMVPRGRVIQNRRHVANSCQDQRLHLCGLLGWCTNPVYQQVWVLPGLPVCMGCACTDTCVDAHQHLGAW